MIRPVFHTLLLGMALSAAGTIPARAVATPVQLGSDAAAVETSGLESSAVAAAMRDALHARIGDRHPAALIDAVEHAYEAARFEPMWIGETGPTSQMRALHRRMGAARLDGLDPADYAAELPDPSLAGDPQARASADVAFSRAIALYLTHLGSGRADPKSVSRIITLEPERPDVVRLLPLLSRSVGIAAALRRVEPPHGQYRLLRGKLAALLSDEAAPRPVQIPQGRLLKPGGADQRVPLLRQRLAVAPASGEDAERFDETLVEALQAFQEQAGLNADGILGPRTLIALNGPDPQELIGTIVSNMERWRWEPRDFGSLNVTVNIPEFVVRVRRDGETIHQTRVVVGTPEHKTPVFSDRMSYMVVNPYWNVPSSIVSNEMLPEILADPYGYFDRRGYQVLARSGSKMQQVNPAYIDWRNVDPRSIRIRQVPGERNALGRIKFMFPNQHSVYLHDTPSKRLFQKDYRAFSHGCVRVEEPLEFADALLPQAAPEWTSSRIAKLFGGKERRINLENDIPVHLTYFTLTVDDDGKLVHFEDLYGFDARFLATLDRGPQG